MSHLLILSLDPVSSTESKELCENINEAISQKKQNFAIVYVSKYTLVRFQFDPGTRDLDSRGSRD